MEWRYRMFGLLGRCKECAGSAGDLASREGTHDPGIGFGVGVRICGVEAVRLGAVAGSSAFHPRYPVPGLLLANSGHKWVSCTIRSHLSWTGQNSSFVVTLTYSAFKLRKHIMQPNNPWP